jgi:hypothetical protein
MSSTSIVGHHRHSHHRHPPLRRRRRNHSRRRHQFLRFLNLLLSFCVLAFLVVRRKVS